MDEGTMPEDQKPQIDLNALWEHHEVDGFAALSGVPQETEDIDEDEDDNQERKKARSRTFMFLSTSQTAKSRRVALFISPPHPSHED